MRQIDLLWMWHALCLIEYASAERSSLRIEELLADDYSTRPDRSRRQVNAVTNIALAQVERRVRPPVRAAEMPDFFAMINRQAKLVVNLSRIVGEVLQGRESTHSLCLLDLEQRREELQRRNQAAVSSVHDRHARLDEIDWTMNALDRSAAGLFQIARSLDHLRSTRNEVASQMILIIQHAIESLQHGYAQLADGSPAAECSADAAIGSKSALASYRSLALQGIDQGQELAQFTRRPETSSGSPGRALWLYELHGVLAGIAHELADAGSILKGWSRQLSASLLDRSAGAVVRSLSRQLLFS